VILNELSYSERYSEFVDYVKNPKITSGTIELKPMFDLFCLWFNGSSTKDRDHINRFIRSCVEWDTKYSGKIGSELDGMQMEGGLFIHHLDFFDLDDGETNNKIIVDGIEGKLKTLQSKAERLNYLRSIKRDMKTGMFLPSLSWGGDELTRFIRAQIEFWKNYVELSNNQGSTDEDDSQAEEFVNRELISGLTPGRKVMLLNEFGIIDFLRSENNSQLSIRKLSHMLAPILSENPETIRKIIDPILKSSSAQNNNPYSTKTNTAWLDFVCQKLKLPQKEK